MKAVIENEVKSAQTPGVEAPRQYVAPAVNILETAEGYVLEAEMPGVNKEGLNLTVEEGILTVAGRRHALPGGTALYRETRGSDYRRVFELDPSVDTDRVTARIEQGLLTVTLPKTEKAKPRQITVN